MKPAFEPVPSAFQACQLLAGVDEVGRGPLAGPVVAAAVILPAGFDITGLGDSKRLSPFALDRMAERLMRHAKVGIAYVPAPQIDVMNIRHASLLAMARAVAALPQPPDGVMVDGRDIPPGLPSLAYAFIKGDARFAAIAAASIIAKVARDRMMAQADDFFPGYDFGKHRGYPVKKHIQAIADIGLSPLHRRSYAPCRSAES